MLNDAYLDMLSTCYAHRNALAMAAVCVQWRHVEQDQEGKKQRNQEAAPSDSASGSQEQRPARLPERRSELALALYKLIEAEKCRYNLRCVLYEQV